MALADLRLFTIPNARMKWNELPFNLAHFTPEF
jgi:hypothetical protein